MLSILAYMHTTLCIHAVTILSGYAKKMNWSEGVETYTVVTFSDRKRKVLAVFSRIFFSNALSHV